MGWAWGDGCCGDGRGGLGREGGNAFIWLGFAVMAGGMIDMWSRDGVQVLGVDCLRGRARLLYTPPTSLLGSPESELRTRDAPLFNSFTETVRWHGDEAEREE